MIDAGETAVRATIWFAVACYPAGPLGRVWGSLVWRAIWTLGCAAFLVHVAAAFHVHYAWSHAIALRETTRQTEELVGRAVGGGIYVNYLFAALWCVDAAWWWRSPASYQGRALAAHVALHGFLVFVVFHGAVVFVAGPVRWLGIAATGIAVAALATSVRVERAQPGSARSFARSAAPRGERR